MCRLTSWVAHFYLHGARFQVTGHSLTQTVDDTLQKAVISALGCCFNEIVHQILADNRSQNILLDKTQVRQHENKLLTRAVDVEIFLKDGSRRDSQTCSEEEIAGCAPIIGNLLFLSVRAFWLNGGRVERIHLLRPLFECHEQGIDGSMRLFDAALLIGRNGGGVNFLVVIGHTNIDACTIDADSLLVDSTTERIKGDDTLCQCQQTGVRG